MLTAGVGPEVRRMVGTNRMTLGRYEFDIDFGSFRRITQCWSGPGWDFNFCGACVNCGPEHPISLNDRIGVFCEAAPLPFDKAADYTGIDLLLPGDGVEGTDEPHFAIDVGESYNASDVRLRFVERVGNLYRIELSGIASAQVFGHPEPFQLNAWAKELPDHAY